MENNKIEEKKDVFESIIDEAKKDFNYDDTLKTNIYDSRSDSLKNGVDSALDLSRGVTFEKVYVPEKPLENPPIQNPTKSTHNPVKIGGVLDDSNSVSGADIKKAIEDFKRPGPDLLKSKVESINIGKMVTIIYGDFDNQKVLKGRIVSMIDSAVTVIDQNEEVEDPIVVPYNKIIDIFEVKKFKKNKEPFSVFKLNKKVREFFTGTEEELEHAYKQKITVKKLREELKKKDKR